MGGVKALQGAPKRRRHSKDEVARIVAEYQRGTLTQREVAEHHGVCIATIQNWLRRVQPAEPEANGWIEIVPSPPRSTNSYRIELPNGRVLVLGTGWQAPQVRELIEAIST